MPESNQLDEMNRRYPPTSLLGADLAGTDNFNPSAEGPMFVESAHDWEELFARLKSAGADKRPQIDANVEDVRRLAAELLGVPAERLAFMPGGYTTALYLLCSRIPQLHNRHNIILPISEYPGTFQVCFDIAARTGADIRVVDPLDAGTEINEIMKQVDENTRLLVLSHQSFVTGRLLDIEALWTRVKDKFPNAVVVVDFTQTLGRIVFDAGWCDFGIGSVFKYAKGPGGFAVMVEGTRPIVSKVPGLPGLTSIENSWATEPHTRARYKEGHQRWESGMLPRGDVIAWRAALTLLQRETIDFCHRALTPAVTAVWEKAKDLSQQFPLTLLTPDLPRRCSIVAVRLETSALAVTLHRKMLELGTQGHVLPPLRTFRLSLDLNISRAALDRACRNFEVACAEVFS